MASMTQLVLARKMNIPPMVCLIESLTARYNYLISQFSNFGLSVSLYSSGSLWLSL